MGKIIGTYEGKIKIQNIEVEVFAKAYEEIIVTDIIDNHEACIKGLMSWEGEGYMDYEAAYKAKNNKINTEIGNIIIVYCDKKNNMRFVGTGEPKFI